MSNELLIVELQRIATALERMADNGDLRAWSRDALDTLQRGVELMPLERLSEWEAVRAVIERYPDHD